MKLHVMSDLHFEHQRDDKRNVGTFWQKLEAAIGTDKPEACVLAGDIDLVNSTRYGTNDPQILHSLKEFNDRYPAVLYVPGNHEFFDGLLIDGMQRLRDGISRLPNVRMLEPGLTVAVGGTTFAGGTLWYPDCKDRWLKKGWIDYRLIRDANPEVEVSHGLFLEKVLPAGADVVISHMFPTNESISPKFAGSSTNVFFCTDDDAAIAEQKAKGTPMPKLWVHGHTHAPFDYRSRHGFRVFCNPHGYPYEGENPKFWERIAVDTEDTAWYLKTLNGGSNDD